MGEKRGRDGPGFESRLGRLRSSKVVGSSPLRGASSRCLPRAAAVFLGGLVGVVERGSVRVPWMFRFPRLPGVGAVARAAARAGQSSAGPEQAPGESLLIAGRGAGRVRGSRACCN